jgi:hypothetical protein
MRVIIVESNVVTMMPYNISFDFDFSYLALSSDTLLTQIHYNCHSSFLLIKKRLKPCFTYFLLPSYLSLKIHRWLITYAITGGAHAAAQGNLQSWRKLLVANLLGNILGGGWYRYVVRIVTFVTGRF